MVSPAQAIDVGYSPNISIELFLHNERFDIASIGPSAVVVRSPRLTNPGQGTIRLVVADRVTLLKVDMVHGVNPKQREQSYIKLGALKEAVA
jgi:hypothetical protein